MAHGVSEVLGEGSTVKMVHPKQQQQSVHQHHHHHHQQQQQQQQPSARKSVGVMGSRRIFAAAFKLKVLDSYRNDIDCRGNQRATARKYGIHRRQIQKWLQCEDSLRNRCAESENTRVHATTVISSPAGVSKPDGTVTEVTGSAVAPAAPALNLSLARLHGDELAVQQGPPPLPHPPHGGSPSSPKYAAQSGTVAVLPVRHGYQQDSERHHLHRDTEDRVQVTVDVHGYSDVRADQVNYYVSNSDEQRDLGSTASFDNRNEAKVYETLTAYRPPPHPENRYNTGEAEIMHRHRSPPTHHRSQQNYGDVDSPVDGKSSYGSLLAPSMIKTERASPDLAATPGPSESSCSPVVSRVPLSPVSHAVNGIGSSSSSSTSSIASVHFDSPRASASPCSHERAHAHASPSPDSEKPIHSSPRQPQRRESMETTTRVSSEAKGAVDIVEAEIARSPVKEEIHPTEDDTMNGEQRLEVSVPTSYVDYQRSPAVASILDDSCSISPVPDREGYSLPSSPRGPNSSGRSSASCSDSEMDPLDCSSGSQQSSNDLARRRSFSLRFKLDVLDAFHGDVGVAGNQRATARKFGINRRQVQKWLGQETELRGEIALRGNSRQRLGPVQDAASGDSPVDLRTSNYASNLSQDRIDAEYERSPPPFYCCDMASTHSQHLPYYQHHAAMDTTSEAEPLVSCYHSCCMDTVTPITSCYQDPSIRGSCYPDPQIRLHCYSPREYSSEIPSIPEHSEELSSSLKRQHCTLSCCYGSLPSPKRLCLEAEDSARTNSCQEVPPQETPLCLVKAKRPIDSSPTRTEPVTSTVPTPPSVQPPPEPTTTKDGILFKPYLDNPVSKPAKELAIQGDLSPISSQNAANNNNCQGICNLNESRGHDYALELSLRLPVSWRTHTSSYAEFSQVRSAFVRYPASPHYS